MSSRTSKLGWLAAAAVALAPLAAQANVYNLDFTGSPNDVTATIVTADTIDPATHGYDILSITGSVSGPGGGAITGLVANPNRTTGPFNRDPWINDNVYFTTPGTSHFVLASVLFNAGGYTYNLFSVGAPKNSSLSSNNPATQLNNDLYDPGPEAQLVSLGSRALDVGIASARFRQPGFRRLPQEEAWARFRGRLTLWISERPPLGAFEIDPRRLKQRVPGAEIPSWKAQRFYQLLKQNLLARGCPIFEYCSFGRCFVCGNGMDQH